MSRLSAKKTALCFALLSFGILTIGSMLGGARALTAFIRGIEAMVVFGLLAWGFVAFFFGIDTEIKQQIEEGETEKDAKDEGDEDKGTHIDNAV